MQPQYAYQTAPMNMPLMAHGGLAALANQYRRGGGVRYFEEGGDAATGGADSSTEGGAGAAFGGGSDPGPSSGGADQSAEGGAGAAFSGPSETQSMAQAEIGNQAVTNDMVAAAIAGPLGAQIAAEADQTEADQAAANAAALGAQANAIAAEIAAQQEEDAKAAEMAAVMSGQVAGFPGPAPTPSFGISFQNPFTTDISKGFGIFSPFATVTHPLGKTDVSVMDVAAPAMGKGAQAVNTAVNVGNALGGFAEGGLAAAHKAQSAGRGQDTMLGHMTPGEVKGLQALAMAHGGSLTINPETGLPEAGFLQKILPTLLGAGLSFIPGVGPLMAAGIVGGGYGIAKGSLAEGLKAGLGAYGGAGLASGLTAAGATTAQGVAATEAAKQATGQVLADEAAKNAFLETGVVTSEAAKQAAAQTIGDQATRDAFLKANLSNTLPSASTYAATATPAQIAAQQGISGNLSMAARGPEALLTEQGRSAFMKGAPTGSLMSAGTSLASAMTPEPEPLKTADTFIRPYSLEVDNLSGQDPYGAGDTREREQVRYRYSPLPIYRAAQGGQINPDYNMAVGQNGGFSDSYNEGGLSALAKRRKSLTGDKRYKFAQDRRDSSMEASIEQNFAKGGMKDALPPRFLQGAGDGMSDSIKARIGGVQEARLADGEFVVPADVVSHLGNGSSKAGAKKLYAMMDKIRKARTGRTRQAPEVNPNKYMPA